MKKYTAIVLLLSFVSLLLAKTDTTVEHDNTSGDVAYVERKGTDGTDQLNSLKRLSYCRTAFSLYASSRWLRYQSVEDTAGTVIEEEKEKAGGCFLFTPPGNILLYTAGAVVLIYLMATLILGGLSNGW
ncbi:hypothetical protein AMJ52_08000 [candidate division TA06 bacterium DG_78]|uniref:Uncharacterized protein n=1 Tax=candidate division TA06 bacterium DG_78 TaxID=1703772 RepID=A0A0S7YBY0_UNCT6|nr:MAG: hypothetical protein AMJ52_08000 [candidate division TA06 bacterium DG_78]